MRRLTALIFGVFALLTPTGALDAESAGALRLMDLVAACQSELASERRACDGYLHGVGDMHESVYSAATDEPLYCLPKGAGTPVARDAFLVWAARNPMAEDRYAVFGVMEALTEQFPCWGLRPAR